MADDLEYHYSQAMTTIANYLEVKCHAPQVVLLGHTWSHQYPYQNFQLSLFPITIRNLAQSGCDEIKRSYCLKKEQY